MKHAHFILGLTMLCVAGTVAAYIVLQPQEPTAAAQTMPRPDPFRGSSTATSAGTGTKSKAARMAVLLGGVEAPANDPILVERAALVEKMAHRRLAELAGQFNLSRTQQAQIFPLLARSSPHYDASLEITGRRGNSLVVPITRREADREIHELLDATQQADFERAEAEKDLWWSSVITRLERDLRNSTQQSPETPAAATAPLESDPPPPAATPPAHRGRNLFDR